MKAMGGTSQSYTPPPLAVWPAGIKEYSYHSIASIYVQHASHEGVGSLIDGFGCVPLLGSFCT